MVFRIVTRVVKMKILLHVLVEVFTLNIQQQGVCVRVYELSFVSILNLQVVVVELVHQQLRQLENAHSHVDGSVK